MDAKEILDKLSLAFEEDDKELGKEALLEAGSFLLFGFERIVLALEEIAENGR